MFKNVFHTDPENSQKINTKNDWEVDYWSSRFHVTKDELKRIIRSTGSSIDKIKKYLSSK